jgi:hypothetical protein
MTTQQAEAINTLLWKIRATEGNIKNLERYLEYRQSPDVKTNTRPDHVHVQINTYQRGCFEFVIDEGLAYINASTTLKMERDNLTAYKQQLEAL